MMQPFNLVRRDEGSNAHLYLYGDIVADGYVWDDESQTDGIAMVNQLAELDGADVTVHINSFGGDVSAGLALYQALTNYGGKVTTVVDGFACSAASIVFMAGQDRIMPASSLLMIHNAWTTAAGNAHELRKQADDLDKINDMLVGIYQQYLSIPEDELRGLLDAESWLTPEESLSMGFCTQVGAESQSTRMAASAFRSLVNKLKAEMPEAHADQPEEEPEIEETKEPEEAPQAKADEQPKSWYRRKLKNKGE